MAQTQHELEWEKARGDARLFGSGYIRIFTDGSFERLNPQEIQLLIDAPVHPENDAE